MAHTGYGSFLEQTFASKHRTVSVESSRSAKLYNGTMDLPHRICTISQIPHTVEKPKTVPSATPAAIPTVRLDYGNASPGIDQWEHGYAYMQNEWAHGYY